VSARLKRKRERGRGGERERERKRERGGVRVCVLYDLVKKRVAVFKKER
jgi:hypothetical protein